MASHEAMRAADVALDTLGITVDEVAAGRAVARLRIGENMANGYGMAHGCFVFAVADTAFAYACNSEDIPSVARQCEITFIRPAEVGDELVAVAERRSLVGRSGIYDVRVTRHDEVVAEFRGHSAGLGKR